MSDAAFCKRCGTAITADTAQGLCPACLLEQGLGMGGAAGFAGGRDAPVPGQARQRDGRGRKELRRGVARWGNCRGQSAGEKFLDFGQVWDLGWDDGGQ